MRSVTLTVTLRKRDTLRTASTPFFSTLRAIGVIRQCRFRAPDHPPKETATRCNDKGCGFLISQNNKKASSFSHSDFYALFHESGGLKIMAKVNLNSPITMEEAFESFLFSKSAQGLTDKTLKSYKSHFKCISKYLDTTIKLNSLM